MARFESEPSLAASLLDRLLDEDPTQTKMCGGSKNPLPATWNCC
jgi:hypothetical protein